MLPGSRSHRCTRSLTSCSISVAWNPQPSGVVGPIFRDQRAGDIVAMSHGRRTALIYLAFLPLSVPLDVTAGESGTLLFPVSAFAVSPSSLARLASRV